MHKILAYGTLREGDYNFDRIKGAFGASSIKKIGELRVPGFKMYNLGPYPAIQSTTPEDKITCDILEVDEQANKFIDVMERSAGYDQQFVEIEGTSYKIYPFKSDLNHMPCVSSGDWFKKG